MPEQAMSSYVPLDVPTPPIPDTQVFSELQWKTLLSLADTVIPSIRTSARDSSTKVIPASQFNVAVSTLAANILGPDAVQTATQYLEESASSNPGFRDAVQRLFSSFVPQEGRNGLSLVLNALNTRAGSLLITGSTTPIQDQPLDVRERVFASWDSSRLQPLRAVYRALSSIFKRTWVSMTPSLPPIIGFPRVPIYGKPADGFEYEFLQLPPGSEPETIETDVVIVGSGCGGAVAAKNLAEAGHRVLVVEKSYHYPSKYFPMDFPQGTVNMFESGGATMSDDGSMAILAGSTWGGGGTINWSASLQTQGYVRREWSNSGLPFFTSSDFQKSLDRVCDRMGVNTEYIEHNHPNRVILDGARKLGYAARDVPQNTGNADHYCGHCIMGCPSARKKGPTETFLMDAAKAGATFAEGFRADKILFSHKKGKRVASGVKGTWTSRDSYLGTNSEDAVTREVIVNAKKVVVSCGTLQSPLLLLRSGLKNSQIGRNLYLHPVILAGATFEDEMRPWEGAALTTVINEFENLDGHGHGVKIETLSMLPSVFIPVFPWRDGLDYKLWAARLNNMMGMITLTRDRDTGRVYPDPVDGRCRVDYTPSSYDRKHMMEALIECAKVTYVSGAKEIHHPIRDLPPFIRPAEDSELESSEGINNAALQAWITEVRRKSPMSPEKTLFASAHQMGTCRMGTSAKMSVVDQNCQVWGTEGLHVVDASVFPSASGVNPMVTNMGIADWASANIAKSLEKQKGAFVARL